MTENDSITRLQKLYHETSKHSNYQLLAPSVQNLIGVAPIDVRSRHETERMAFISQHVDFNGKTAFDIGGNTGFFSFEALARGASYVHYLEGNRAHSEFVNCARNALGLQDRLSVQNEYCDFCDENLTKCDVGFVLNVLHHVGDDFGDSALDMATAKQQILDKLNWLSGFADTLVFQLGFCWKGNRKLLLFENGTKEEMIDFIEKGVISTWKVDALGIAEKTDGITYCKLTSENINRDDSLGEFLNRPLFILSRC
jgi:hypothetical protein